LQLELPHFGQPPLRVGLGGSARADVELTHFATLRGRVLDPDGKPAAKAKVEIGPPPYLSASRYIDAETGAEGQFAFTDLPPGTYRLRATAAGGPSPESEKAPRTEVVPTYFPSVFDPGRGGAHCVAPRC
jgi:hypothetical protein